MKKFFVLTIMLSMLLMSFLTGCGGSSSPTTPPVATNVLEIIPATGQLAITWSAVSGATSYEVYYNQNNTTATATKYIGDTDNTDTLCIITGLTNKTLYYVWITAKNAGGSSGFSPVASGTPTPTIFLYAATLHDGNLGGRTGADALASSNLPSNLAGKTVHAYISVSSSDEIIDMPTNYGVPNDIPIVNTNGTELLGNNWADLLDGSLGCMLRDALGLPSTEYYWWSGSNSDGSLNAANCNGWTTTSVAGNTGLLTNVGGAWLSSTYNAPGTNQCYLLGIAY